MIAGPSTVTALLNSLAMGFKTVAINKKANEVWKVLGAAKTQYEKFGVVLAKARKRWKKPAKLWKTQKTETELSKKSKKRGISFCR